jgi:hypothetical protein
VNWSQAVRDLLKENPKIKAKDAVAALAERSLRSLEQKDAEGRRPA